MVEALIVCLEGSCKLVQEMARGMMLSYGANTRSGDTTETFNVTVMGTNAGALPVDCSLTWQAGNATSSIPVTETGFVCTDSAVSVTLARQNIVDFIGWDLTVQLR